MTSRPSSKTHALRHASWRTHLPIGTMSPVSSAIGMNSAGETMPWPGRCQRTSASTPTISPLATETSGWKWTTSWSSAIALRSAVSIAWRATARSRTSWSKTDQRPAGVLRAIHRGVGVADEVVGRGVRVGGECNADARGDVRLSAVELERERQRLDEALGAGDRVIFVGDVLADEDELVAAEACQQLVAADGLAQARGDGEQQAITGVVAEAVVDDLEAVEVDEEDGDLLTAAVDAG